MFEVDPRQAIAAHYQLNGFIKPSKNDEDIKINCRGMCLKYPKKIKTISTRETTNIAAFARHVEVFLFLDLVYTIVYLRYDGLEARQTSKPQNRRLLFDVELYLTVHKSFVSTSLNIIHCGCTFHLSYPYWTITSLYENTTSSITVTVHKLT
jgi:hypothetical protein